jgi:acetyl-CoA acyltransferase
MREAVIVAASRTAVGKSSKGSTRNQRSDEMAATVIQELLRPPAGKLRAEEIDDVFLGCAMPEGSQGLNTARVIALRAGLPVDVPAQTVNRFCSSGLQTIASAAERIISGGAETVVAGGVEPMSLVPMTGFRISPNPYMAAEQPEVYMNMGLTAERVADEFEVSRQAQDEFALRSHQRAVAATEAGKFKEEIVPVVFEEVSAGENGSQKRREITFEVDEHLRADTTRDGLA